MSINRTILCIITLMLSAITTAPIVAKTIKSIPEANQPHISGLAIINVKDGDALFGMAELKIRVPDRGKEGNALTILVDGRYDGFYPYQAEQTLHGFITSASLDSDAYSNGWHCLNLRLTSRRQARYHVRFVNDISQISVEDVANPTLYIAARNETDKPWTVTISSTTVPALIVRVFHGHGKSINVRWDGKDAHGKSVPDNDTYTVAIVAGKAQPHLRSVVKTLTPVAGR